MTVANWHCLRHVGTLDVHYRLSLTLRWSWDLTCLQLTHRRRLWLEIFTILFLLADHRGFYTHIIERFGFCFRKWTPPFLHIFGLFFFSLRGYLFLQLFYTIFCLSSRQRLNEVFLDLVESPMIFLGHIAVKRFGMLCPSLVFVDQESWLEVAYAFQTLRLYSVLQLLLRNRVVLLYSSLHFSLHS